MSFYVHPHYSTRQSPQRRKENEERQTRIMAERAKVEQDLLSELRAGQPRARAIWTHVTAGMSYEAAITLVDAG